VEVTATFLADYAKADAANKVNAIGVFNHTEATEFPATMAEFFWVVGINAERTEFERPVLIQLALVGGSPPAPIFDMTQEVDVSEAKGPGHFFSGNMVFGFTTLVLPSPGRYEFRAKVNDSEWGKAVFYAVSPVKEASQ
jgi:hypothetical protein